MHLLLSSIGFGLLPEYTGGGDFFIVRLRKPESVVLRIQKVFLGN